jgi:(1->4)-alpha-D-glucan 1-alpha-D-glucosylmutase
VVLKIASPGVPDFYQGTELWDLSLVDPDNRRPVDYGSRRSLLEQLLADGMGSQAHTARLVDRLVTTLHDGRVKLLVTARALALRRSVPRLFQNASYEPLAVSGPRAAHVIAFVRRSGTDAVMAVVGRHHAALASAGPHPVGEEAWRDTVVVLPEGLAGRRYREALTNRPLRSSTAPQLRLDDVFAHLPVALIEVS